jgi:four helix bundle protein
MKDFRQLQVWEKAHRVTLSVYKITANFPVQERYGLTSQLRRASASIAANIAEGCGRNSDGDFHRFLVMAMRSAVEVEYFLLLARDLGLITDGSYRDAARNVVEVQRMLGALVRKVGATRTSARR